MRAWAAVALGIAAYDVALARAGDEMLSHTYWRLLGDPRSRWLPVGAWVTVTYHLNRPRRPWGEALTVGLVAAATTRILR